MKSAHGKVQDNISLKTVTEKITLRTHYLERVDNLNGKLLLNIHMEKVEI